MAQALTEADDDEDSSTTVCLRSTVIVVVMSIRSYEVNMVTGNVYHSWHRVSHRHHIIDLGQSVFM